MDILGKLRLIHEKFIDEGFLNELLSKKVVILSL